MRKIVDTNTGRIVVDTDLSLEYLFVGDYGKENNIKADFLGFTKRIEKVEHNPVDITDKMVVTVSTQKGCPMSCNFCDCPKVGFKGNATLAELLSEITTAISMSGLEKGKRLNVHYARMGEPSFNFNVIESARVVGEFANNYYEEYHPVVSTMCPKSNRRLKEFLAQWTDLMIKSKWNGGLGLQFSINTLNEEDRNKMFNNQSLSLQEISDIIAELPMPVGRKYTLNFAVTSDSNLDVDLMNKYFDKEKCIVKITPIHETVEAVNNSYEIIKDFDVYEKFEKPLVEDGWDVIVFVPSQEEDSDRITCGNALISEKEQ
jgi:23S rRNA (adenine2503-C2)-methyltransferase